MEEWLLNIPEGKISIKHLIYIKKDHWIFLKNTLKEMTIQLFFKIKIFGLLNGIYKFQN